jgi:hypothetical protein
VAGSALFHVKISKKKDNRRQGQNVQQWAKVVSKNPVLLPESDFNGFMGIMKTTVQLIPGHR